MTSTVATEPTVATTPTPSPAGRSPRRRARVVAHFLDRHPAVVTLAVGLLIIALPVSGPDLPAAEYRTGLARAHGLVVFDSSWYGGHSPIGYSLLFPVLAALIGAQLTGLLACVMSSWAAGRLVPDRGNAGARWFRFSFAIATTANLVIGRLPFALGLAFGMVAMVWLRGRRPWPAALAAAGCSLASPLAGFFLLLIAVVWLGRRRWRELLVLSPAALGALVAAPFGGGGGVFPFPAGTFLALGCFVVLGMVFVPRTHLVVRRGLIAYALTATALFVVPNPIGGNITRLGTLVAVPLALYVLLSTRRRAWLLALAVPLLVWQLAPVTGAVAASVQDPSRSPAYYTGLLGYLHTQPEPAGRLEIPFTREHWESDYVASHYPLARGWDRQLDLQHNAVLYAPMTQQAYHDWVDANAVDLIALPDVPLDPSGKYEALLIKGGLPWLQPVWHDAHWQVWRVKHAVPLVSGPAQLLAQTVSTATLQVGAPGWVTLRIRYSNVWRTQDPSMCVQPDAAGWIHFYAPTPGVFTLDTQLLAPLRSQPACAALGATTDTPAG